MKAAGIVIVIILAIVLLVMSGALIIKGSMQIANAGLDICRRCGSQHPDIIDDKDGLCAKCKNELAVDRLIQNVTMRGSNDRA